MAMAKNPFGEDSGPARVNPFGDDDGDDPAADPVARIERAVTRIHTLRSQVGADGLTGQGTRQLLDELSTTMAAIARALRQR